MTPPLRALVVDDEPLARERIRTLLEAEPDVCLVAECAHGAEAVHAIRETGPDLVFLDVQMPEVDGFGVVEAVGCERMPATVFVTAYDEHALRAFDAHALDYLLKPFTRERFQRALGRARAEAASRRARAVDERLLSLLGSLRPAADGGRFVVRAGPRLLFVRAAEVDWVEAEGNYARLHAGKRTHLVRETMAALEARLCPGEFVRVHRSTIVRVDRIREVEPLFGGEYVLVLHDGTRLTSSRGYRKNVSALLDGAL